MSHRAKSYGQGAKVPSGAGRLALASEIRVGDVIGWSGKSAKADVTRIEEEDGLVVMLVAGLRLRRAPDESVILYMRDGFPVYPDGR